MAKISFTKFGLKPNNSITTIYFNEQPIEVKQYLPIEEKLELISAVIELSHDQNNFSNPLKIQVYTALEMISKYTNISFTEKQKENITKTYDIINGNGMLGLIIEAIPQQEYDIVIKGIYDTIESVYAYRNSVLGILDAVSADYSALNLDAETIHQKIADPDNMAFLKEVMTKLG